MTSLRDEAPGMGAGLARSGAVVRATGRIVEKMRSSLRLRSKVSNAAGTQVALTSPRGSMVPHTPIHDDQERMEERTFAGRALYLSFLIMVAIPSLCALLYYSLFASDVFVSETRLTVRAAAEQKQQMTDTVSAFSKLGLNGAKSSVQDAYMVLNYSRSMPIIEAIGGRDYLESIYSRDSIDWLSRLASDKPLETSWKYWGGHVISSLNAQAGIVTIKVFAYRAEDARELARRIVEACEKLINQISARSRDDAVEQTRKEVEDKQEALLAARAAIVEFRNRNVTIDPVAKAKDIGEIIAKLTLQRLEIQSLLAGVSPGLAPNAPTLLYNRSRLEEIDRQISLYKSQLTATDSVTKTVAGEFADYERLKLAEMFSEKLYQMAIMSHERNLQEAGRQQLYLSAVVPPSLPERPLFPERTTNTLLAFVCAFVIWGICAMFSATVFDHIV